MTMTNQRGSVAAARSALEAHRAAVVAVHDAGQGLSLPQALLAAATEEARPLIAILKEAQMLHHGARSEDYQAAAFHLIDRDQLVMDGLKVRLPGRAR